MGFLDELKRQATLAQTEKNETSASIEADIRLVNEKLEKVFFYFHELGKQLAVLKPSSPYVFDIYGCDSLIDLTVQDLWANACKKMQGNDFTDLIDRVTLSLSYSNDRKFLIERNEPALIKRQEDFLYRHAIKFEAVEIKDEKRVIETVKFEIPCEVRALVIVFGNSATKKISFVTKNVERLGEQEFSFDAEQIDENLLDEFAKFLIGFSNEFRSMHK